MTPEEYLPEKHLDLAEFFISFGSVREFWEVHHDAGNHMNNLMIELPSAEALAKIPKPGYKDVTFHRERFVTDDGAFAVARAVQFKPRKDGKPSTVNDPADRDTGYTGEIRLPGLASAHPTRNAVLTAPTRSPARASLSSPPRSTAIVARPSITPAPRPCRA